MHWDNFQSAGFMLNASRASRRIIDAAMTDTKGGAR
jgi:hypothetical protein